MRGTIWWPDEREGICFNVYVYNVQPGIGIDYATGASWAEGEQGEIQSSPTPAGTAYVLNTNTKKFHLPTCASVEDMKPENRTDYTGSREALLDSVWGFDFVGETNSVDVYIRFLRSKIDEAFDIKLIHTVRGVGYVIREE